MTQVAIRSSTPPSLARLLAPTGLARNLWSHRDLIGQFTLRIFHARYRGTRLGVLWSVLLPLILLSVYTFIFNVIFQGRWGVDPNESRAQYAVVIFCGMVTYGLFAESVVRSVTLVVENPNYVKRVVFPVEILPVASLASSMMYAGIGLALATIAGMVWVGGLSWTALLLPVVVLPLLAISLGLGWFLASLGVFIRDVSTIVSLLVGQVLFFLTPIFYRIEQLPDDLRWIAQLNPLTCSVDGARRVLVFHQQPDWVGLGISMLLGLVAMQLGYAWFMKSKRGFADVL